jgi:hypothetical protein
MIAIVQESHFAVVLRSPPRPPALFHNETKANVGPARKCGESISPGYTASVRAAQTWY